jgi:hypothetical protein
MTTADDRLLILNESDTKGCLHGCGCDEPLPADFHVNLAWYAEIEDGEAVVLCPTCWGGQCFDADAGMEG